MEKEVQTFLDLLTHVSAINEKYRKISEITGENFNIFRILKIEANEASTHSAFLCELLNPTGNHGFRDAFLKLFLKLLRDKHKENPITTKFAEFDTDTACATAESFIGFISEDGNEGGRIDILLQDKENHAIVIENKINAQDIPKQLKRYKNAYENAPIIYLTLIGKSPSDISRDNLNEGEDYLRISYKDDIIAWLELCRKEAVNHPILRESIAQYIHLIKHLTGQTMNEHLKTDLEQLITSNQERYEAAALLSKTYNDVYYKIFTASFEEIKEVWMKRFNDRYDIQIFTYNGYDFFFRPSIEQGYLHFDIYPEKPEMKDQYRQAKDAQVVPIYRYFTSLKNSQELKVSLQNQNYVAWLPSTYSPENLVFEKRIKLLDNEEKHQWAEDIIKEAIELMRFIYDDIKKKGELEVIYSNDLIEFLSNKGNADSLI